MNNIHKLEESTSNILNINNTIISDNNNLISRTNTLDANIDNITNILQRNNMT
jgi:hypothetical protein